MPNVEHPVTDKPSLAELAAQLAAMETDDDPSGGVSDKALALRDLIETMRPQTLADAAAALAHAATAAWELPIIEDLPESAIHRIQQLERRLLAILPIVVRAAGASMDQAEFAEARKRSATLLNRP